MSWGREGVWSNWVMSCDVAFTALRVDEPSFEIRRPRTTGGPGSAAPSSPVSNRIGNCSSVRV